MPLLLHLLLRNVDPESKREFVECAALGSFAKCEHPAGIAGEIAGGLNPVADVRDVSAAAYHLVEGKEGAGWELGFAVAGIVPALGDAAKAAGKAGYRSMSHGFASYVSPHGTSYALTDKALTELGRGLPLPSWATDVASLSGKRVLDVGGGGGAFTRELRENGADAYAIDIETLKFSEAKVPNDHFVQGDASKLPFGGGTFDVIYSNYSVFYYFENPDFIKKTLEEIAQVVKVGGEIRLVGVDPRVLDVLERVPGLKLLEKSALDHGCYPAVRILRQ